MMIVGYDKNMAIGFEGDMPWKKSLPADLENFKNLSMGGTVIMGETTYKTIGKPLGGRKNIVISRDPNLQIDGAMVVNDVQKLTSADIEGLGVVMGGAQIYRLMLPMVNTIMATEVDGEFVADTYLDPIDMNEWQEVKRHHHPADAQNLYDFDFVEYKRATN